jgi:hypothetical protein
VLDLAQRQAAAEGIETDSEMSARMALATSRQGQGAGGNIGFISLPPRYFVVLGDAEPPEGRRRFLDGNLEQSWTPEYRHPDKDASFAELARGPQLVGYWVSYRWRAPYCDCESAHFEPMFRGAEMKHDLVHRECGRAARNKRGNVPMRDHIASLQIQAMSDFDFEGHYPTIPGNDIARFKKSDKPGKHGNKGDVVYASDGQPLRGGREIIGGRREYREATKDMLQWDNGTQRDIDRAAAARKKAKDGEVARVAQKENHKFGRLLGEL